MKATERSRRFRNADQSERTMPLALLSELTAWTVWLGLLAAGFVIAALDSGQPEYWWVGGGFAVAALLCWIMSRSG